MKLTNRSLSKTGTITGSQHSGKRLARILGATVLLSLLVPGLSARTFHDSKGRAIDAELVSHAGEASDEVVIQVKGRKHTVPVSRFSENDQAFIRRWMKETPAAVSFPYHDYEISAKKVKGDGGNYVFQIEVENQADNPVEGITIKYLVFARNSMDKTVSREGSVEVPQSLKSGATAKLSTEEFDPDQMVVKQDGGISVSSSSSSGQRRRSGRSTLLGVLVRVCDSTGSVVADWRSPGNNFTETWPGEDAGGAPDKERVTIEE
ncbi:hypothetical protein HAHE_25640 [Haloferula helveola]|uniref:Uncharacterized protein n=1 Tax=Haloferula helveola TaxID=490095 RepID=A0ABM7RB13_9BACT|nr:hypothetical protein HAHE_25640 [Haloferula helveola]